jgi:hypothetical protein
VLVEVPPRDREVLASWTRAPSVRAGLAQRARIVLLAAGGVGTNEIARRVGVSKPAEQDFRLPAGLRLATQCHITGAAEGAAVLARSPANECVRGSRLSSERWPAREAARRRLICGNAAICWRRG